MLDLIAELEGDGHTWQQVADAVGEAFLAAADVTRDAVAAAHRRAHQPKPPAKGPGLNNLMVRYVHTIIHAALRDAARRNRVTRNVASAATPPPVCSTGKGRPPAWTDQQLARLLDFAADSHYLPAWLYLAASGSRRGEVLGLKWTEVELDDAWIFCRVDGVPLHPERFSREFLRKQDAYNKANPRRGATETEAPRPPPHLGHPRPGGRHRHPRRQRPPFFF